MKRVALACDLPAAIEREFVDNFEICRASSVVPGTVRDRLALAQQLDGCAAMVIAPPFQVDRDLIECLPASLKVVGTYSVGYEHIDLTAAKERNVSVLHTPDVLTDAVAEIAMLLTLAAARRARESDQLIRQRLWAGWTPTQLIGQGLTGKTMGFFGFGRIGRAIASRARSFGMSICYFDSRSGAVIEETTAARVFDEAEFLRSCDVLVLAAPLNTQTHHFLRASRIELMKQSAIVINIGRGDLLVDEDLISALRLGKIASAGLDVFSGEPKIDNRYFALPNVFMLPHIGSSTLEARIAMGRAIINGLHDVFAERVPDNQLSY